jgi:predicted transcriptional regulator
VPQAPTALPIQKLITAQKGTTLKEAELILQEHRIEKLPVVDKVGKLIGLITYKDIIKSMDSQVYQPTIGYNKYLERDPNFITKYPHLRADKIKAKAKYNIAPNIYNVEVDENIYNWFTKEFLKDE